MYAHVVLLEMQSILWGGIIMTSNGLPTIVRASRAQSTFYAAMHYQKLGMSVIPCRGKLPGVEWQAFQQRRPSVFQIEQWHIDRKFGNVGIVCGDVSGNLVVIDLDGDEAVEAFKIEFPHLTNTYTVASGSGHGQHIYIYPSILPPTTRVMGCKFGNIELRANGCYVVAPPSIHPTSGAPYTVAIEQPIDHVPDLADVVKWIKSLMKEKHGGVMPPPVAPAAAVGIRHASPYAAAALRDEARKVTTARQGWQNNQLNLSAFKMGQLIATGAIDRGQVESALMGAAAACGYIGREGEAPARRTINSGIEGGIKKPQRRS